MGAIWNFNRVLELARGEYFMWAAFDDLRDSRYISTCVAAMQGRPDAVLCCTGIRFIDETGRDIGVQPHLVGIRPVGPTPRQRLREIARAEHWYDFYGLHRTSSLRQTRGAVSTWGFDVVLLLESCLRGPVLLVPEPLFVYRRFGSKTQEDLAETLTTPRNQGGTPVCWSCLTLELLHAVWLSPHAIWTRLLLMSSFLMNFSVLNRPVAASIKSDLGSNLRLAFREREWGHWVSFVLIGALVYPLQNRLTRAVYRSFRRSPADSRARPVSDPPEKP